MPFALGIDPGVSGAAAGIELCAGGPRVDVFDLPTYDIGGRSRLDLHSTWALIRSLAAGSPDVCVCEETHGRHLVVAGKVIRQNPNAVHMLGRTTGNAEAFIIAAGMRITPAEPSVWKKALGVKADKDLTRQFASRLFPNFAHRWSRKKDHNRAEAVLLAWYGLTVVLGVKA